MNHSTNEQGFTFLNLLSKLNPSLKKIVFKIFILLPIAVIFLTALYGYLTIANLKNQNQINIKLLEQVKEDILIATITENCKKAQIVVKDTKSGITKALRNYYQEDLDGMREDYLSQDPQSPFYQIIASEIDNKFINVDNDRNRLFIANRNMILLDNSILYSKYSFTSWDDFFGETAHPKFSKRAIRLMQEQNDATILWVDNEFEIDVEHYDWDPAYDLADFLADKVKSNSLQDLAKFSILISEYIYQHKDIFNVPDVIGGVQTNNDKLYVVQLLSLKDIMDTTPELKEAIDKYNVAIEKEQHYYNENIQYRTIVTVISMVLEVLVFFVIWVLLEYYIYSNRYIEKLNTLYETKRS